MLMQKPEIKIEKIDDCEGIFVIEPLERGFGHTLGNSLRRVLLSSIQGYGVTSIKVEGVLHEFSTIEGVKEDTTELILNLKKLVFRSKSEEPIKITLRKKKPGVVWAGDIQVPAEAEIVNKDLYIATLNEDGRLEMEMTVEKGRGYVSAEQNKRGKESVGEIPIDTIFSPVLRVTYEVAETRVGQRTDFDKLTLYVKTDGSSKPDEALSQAAKILDNHLVLLMNLSAKSMEEEVFGASELLLKHGNLPAIEDLRLSARSFNCLKREGIDTIDKLISYSEEELMEIKNFGAKSIDEVKEKLKTLNLKLKS
ncbi:DNA-directed RNA polymerase subunit alpha [Candidatus Hakubella thermalkaliphila]|uniref:DNA-directed RNA polymerase subunit alpha n=4 Tax=Candidatus Hakubella thermalkaliphila TaxID=2754717 RepID=A0A6V8NTK3_9ACTN|nr:DNA-directed RNA polymerase subunit alpha [Candidatus Hakubella thermalkaliphila]GFP29266.1 DNA-directed RNA polymerase subunit alpha [Candidatus Hakubella thermalkaliphila]GFP39228.1 DNA-directed RNA polymerase subunit alpha [Candidatus Hakubella thermalkaliphila]GFP43159.1 DNA-directed RNA polymerase subunit alpha [Candidatus Hakubella thermalkaliphila]